MYYSPNSPFVRKVFVVAHEVGLLDRIEVLPSKVSAASPDPVIMQVNPLAQIPTVLTDDGLLLADSRVICEYLDEIGGGSIYPRSGPGRFAVLTEHAIADGMITSALSARDEFVQRPAGKGWGAWYDGQLSKVEASIRFFEARADTLGRRVDIATITLACGLAYIDHRFAEHGWASRHPGVAAWYRAFMQRPSMQATTYGVDRLAKA